MGRTLRLLWVMGRVWRLLLVLGAVLAVLASGLAGTAAQANNNPTFTTNRKHIDFLPTDLIVGNNQTLVGPAFKANDEDSGDTLTYTLSDTSSGSGDAAKFSIAASATDATRFQISRLTDTPAGNYAITVTANDNNGGSVTKDVTVVVTDIGTWGQQSKLVAATSRSVLCDPNSRFGYQVAATDEIIVVGAPRADRTPDCMPDDDGPTDNRDEGKVYVFDRVTGRQLARLSSPNPTSAQPDSDGLSGEDIQGFGYSVAADGDVIVVGSPHERFPGMSNETWYGRAYIFEKPSSGWSDTNDAKAYLAFENQSASAGDRRIHFGYAVDIKGQTIAVTSFTDVHEGSDEGKARQTGRAAGVYVFSPYTGRDTITRFAVKLVPGVDFKHTDFTAAGRRPLRRGFSSVAISADENTIAVGAIDHYSDARTSITGTNLNPSQRLGATLADSSDTRGNFGYVYVFEKPRNGWSTVSDTAEVPRLVAKDRIPEGIMGYDIAISDNGDTIVAGAPGRPSSDSNHPIRNYPGAAYVFTKPRNGWTDKESDAKLTTTAATPGGLIGYAVDITPSGDQIAVSHDGSQGSGYRGAALLFNKPRSGWADSDTPDVTFTAVDSKADDTFGGDVHFARDLTLPEEHILLIGQDGHAGRHFDAFVNRGWPTSNTARFGTSSGAVYLYQDTAVRFITNQKHRDFLPAKLIVGHNQTLVGPAFKATGGRNTLTYTLSGTHASRFSLAASDTDPTRQQISRQPDTPAGTYQIVITADDGNGSTATRAVTVVVTDDGDWALQGNKLQAAVSNDVKCDPNSNFGNRIALTDDLIVIGAHRADGTPDCIKTGTTVPGNDDVGAVYVFDRNTGTQLARLSSPYPISGSRDSRGPSYEPIQGFGFSVAADSDTIVVGSPHENLRCCRNNSWVGFVYLYEKPDTGWADTNTPTATFSTPGNISSAGAWRPYWGHEVAIKGDTVVISALPHVSSPSFSATAEDYASMVTQLGGLYVATKPADGWADTSSYVRLIPGADFKHGGTSVSNRRPLLRSFSSIDISADGNTIVAGLPRHHADRRTMSSSGLPFDPARRLGATLRSGNEGNFGWVYVFEKPSDGWASIPNTTKVPRLVAKERIANGYMGWDVAVSDDGNTIVAGAPGRWDRDDETRSNYPGAAYVFTKPASGWADKESDARLSTTAANPGSRIGLSVDITASGNRIAVSHHASQGSGYRGSTLIYNKPSPGWTNINEPHDVITATDSVADDAFGAAVQFADETNLYIGQDGEADGHHIHRGRSQTDFDYWSPTTGAVYLYQGPAYQPPPPPPPPPGPPSGPPSPPGPPGPPEPPASDDPMPGQCPDGQSTFADVNPTSTHKAGIDCVAALKITTGTKDGNYQPNKAVTRSQMATFLKRLWETTGNTCPTTTQTFPDVKPDSTHKPGIDCVAALKITTGTRDGNYQPNKAVTRSQMATFLKRLWQALPPPAA